MITEDAWNTNTRKKEISAETAPLPNAVKKPEQKILKPASRKEKENNRNACFVSANRLSSKPTKM